MELSAEIINNPLYAYIAAFIAGLATSLGPCTFARAGALLGYTGSAKGVTKVWGFFLAFMFLVGLVISYTILGTVGFVAVNAVEIGNALYYFAGAVVIIMGLHFTGIVQIRLRKFSGPAATVSMGLVFGLMLCPCCIPGLLTIFTFTFAQGKLAYGISLVFAYTIGHGIPLLLVGMFAGAIRTFKKLQVYSEYINLGLGTIMIVVGVFLIWIA